MWGDGRVDSHYGLQLAGFVVAVVLDTRQGACVAAVRVCVPTEQQGCQTIVGGCSIRFLAQRCVVSYRP